MNAEIASGSMAGEQVVAKGLSRKISWLGAFWIASGVPAYVLFSLAELPSTAGNIAWLIWIAIVLFGTIHAFTYAEISGLFPHKSGGSALYGAIAWIPYAKIIGPIMAWVYWLGWTPIITIGCSLAAGYSLETLFPASSIVNTWSFTIINLSSLSPGLSLRVNSVYVLGSFFMLISYFIQRGGVFRTYKTQMMLGVAGLTPLILISLVPLFSGTVDLSRLYPFTPVGSNGWDGFALTSIVGALFLAAYSAYGMEAAAVYTRELSDPKKDTLKAIIFTSIVCLLVYGALPLVFQGYLGMKGILAPGVSSGLGVGDVLADMVGGGIVIKYLIIFALIMTLMLGVQTTMAGSSRALFQASRDGWLPKFLGHINKSRVPTYAMTTDLIFNFLLLSVSNYIYLLVISNVCYITFHYLAVNSAWIHRIDRPNVNRPYKMPKGVFISGIIIGFIDASLIGMGTDVFGSGALWVGLAVVFSVIPFFIYRHYIVDKGVFPKEYADDIPVDHDHDAGFTKRAGILPYAALASAIIIMLIGYNLGVYTA